MSTLAERHPAGNGLLDSGYVVSVVRSADVIDMYVREDDGFICVTVPGNPCAVLLGCAIPGAEALIARLSEGLDRLRAAREHRP